MSNRKTFKHSKDVEEVEAPITSKPRQQKPRSFNRSEKKSSRDEKRLEDFRGKQGERTVQENRTALFDKLFFGFTTVSEALRTVQTQQISRTLMLPVSTRSAGFIIRNLMIKFIQLGVIDHDQAKLLASALYRVTLLQLDLKIEEAMLLQHSRNLGLESYEDVFVDGEQRRALEAMGANFSPLINYISSLGFIKTSAKCYLPRYPLVINRNCDYLHQHFGTLRTTV